jgi:hypothetical protein
MTKESKLHHSCSANQQNVTLHVKHDHQYRRNFKPLNIVDFQAWLSSMQIKLSLLWLTCRLLIGRWPVGIKPMLSTGSYATSLGVSLRWVYVRLLHTSVGVFIEVKKTASLQSRGRFIDIIGNELYKNIFSTEWSNLKALYIQHGERRTYFLISSVSINVVKTNNAPNYVERFKVPTILMVMFNM